MLPLPYSRDVCEDVPPTPELGELELEWPLGRPITGEKVCEGGGEARLDWFVVTPFEGATEPTVEEMTLASE